MTQMMTVVKAPLPKLFQQAADYAVTLHKEAGIGTRPKAEWDNHDVTDTTLIFEALSVYGLECNDQNEAILEKAVSEIVFAEWRH